MRNQRKLSGTLACLAMLISTTATKAATDDSDLTLAEQEALGRELGEALQNYLATAFYCKEFGLISPAEYFSYRRNFVDVNSLIVGTQKAFLLRIGWKLDSQKL